jgi:hypothetical protein
MEQLSQDRYVKLLGDFAIHVLVVNKFLIQLFGDWLKLGYNTFF